MQVKVVLLVLLMVTNLSAIDYDRLFESIEQVEGSWDSRITEKEIGKYCITKKFFIDSGIKGSWQQCTNRKFSQRVIRAYWAKYAKTESVVELAALVNGGPNGVRKQQALAYARKVKAIYESED